MTSRMLDTAGPMARSLSWYQQTALELDRKSVPLLSTAGLSTVNEMTLKEAIVDNGASA